MKWSWAVVTLIGTTLLPLAYPEVRASESPVSLQPLLVIARMTGETPWQSVIDDKTAPPNEWTAYRLLVTGSGERLSNPVFVGPIPAVTVN